MEDTNKDQQPAPDDAFGTRDGAHKDIEEALRGDPDVLAAKALVAARYEAHQAYVAEVFAEAAAEGRALTIEEFFNMMMPEIELKPGELSRIGREIASALARSDNGYYRRGPYLVKLIEIRESIMERDVERQPGAAMFRMADASMVRIDISKCSRTFRWKVYPQRGPIKVPVDLPRESALSFLSVVHELIDIPIAIGITKCPVMDEDGSLNLKGGYDPASRLIVDLTGLNVSDLKVPERPTFHDAKAALATMMEPFAEFPFANDVDRAVIASAMLSAAIRPTLSSCPLHGLSSPAFGTGKTLGGDVIAIVSTGARLTVIAPGHTQEELEKRVDTALIAGDPIVCLDNISRPLGGDNLCAALTATSANVRVLGKSIQQTVPCTTFWLATGANLAMRGDMVRRSIVARLDANQESPEKRQGFKIPDLPAWTMCNRARLLSAIFTILRAHALAGHPHGDSKLGSFEQWSVRVRAALIWLGMKDPIDSQQEIAAADPVKATVALIFEAIHEAIGEDVFTVSDMAKLVQRVNDPRAISVTDAQKALVEALMMEFSKGRAFDASGLGYWLRSKKDVVSGGLKLVSYGIGGRNKIARYRIKSAGDAGDAGDKPVSQTSSSKEEVEF